MDSTTIFFFLTIVTCSLASHKKGVSIGPKHYKCGDDRAFKHISWWYDWNFVPGYHIHCNETLHPGRVPMVWSMHMAHHLSVPHDAKFILGFNEPNHKKQANMAPQLAATLWREVEKDAGNRILVSPSAAPCGGTECLGDTEEWFDQFFHACSGCRVDFLATHHYSCNADATMSFLHRLHQRYGKKIWLTEFACPHHNTVEAQLKYMRAVLPRLESADYVDRYAWFVSRLSGSGFVPGAASLLSETSSTLTSLGHFYDTHN